MIEPRQTVTAALVAALLVLAACGSSAGTSSPATSAGAVTASPSPTSTPAAPSSPGSEAPSDSPASDPVDDLGPFACDSPMEGAGSAGFTNIVDVRVGEHPGYDRVVFEFTAGTPEFVLSIDEPPFLQDGSGLPVEVDGEAFWVLRMSGATKLSPAGGVTYQGPREFTPGFPQLIHLVETGDFEAQSTWVIGTAAAACVRVLALSAPPRLVIDIER